MGTTNNRTGSPASRTDSTAVSAGGRGVAGRRRPTGAGRGSSTAVSAGGSGVAASGLDGVAASGLDVSASGRRGGRYAGPPAGGRGGSTASPSGVMSSLGFAAAARSLSCAARLRGLAAPDFASPPRRPDLDRSIRRRAERPLVSVRLRGRPRSAVLADMIEGIIVANHLTGSRADLVRSALWLAVETDSHPESHAEASLRGAATPSMHSHTIAAQAAPTAA